MTAVADGASQKRNVEIEENNNKDMPQMDLTDSGSKNTWHPQTTEATFMNSQTRHLYVRSRDAEIQSKLLRVGIRISHIIGKMGLLGNWICSRKYGRNGFRRVSPHYVERNHFNTIHSESSTGTGVISLSKSMMMNNNHAQNLVEGEGKEFGIIESQSDAAVGTAGSNENVLPPSKDGGGLISSSAPTLKNNEMVLHRHDSDDSDHKQNVSSLPFYRAFLEGYLLPFEYAQLGSITAFLCLILLFGLSISFVNSASSWVGHMVWCSIYILIFTAIAVIKVTKSCTTY